MPLKRLSQTSNIGSTPAERTLSPEANIGDIVPKHLLPKRNGGTPSKCNVGDMPLKIAKETSTSKTNLISAFIPQSSFKLAVPHTPNPSPAIAHKRELMSLRAEELHS